MEQKSAGKTRVGMRKRRGLVNFGILGVALMLTKESNLPDERSRRQYRRLKSIFKIESAKP